MKIMNVLIASSTLVLSSLHLHAIDPAVDIDLSQQSKPATLKVLLAKNAPEALVDVRGSYEIFDPATGLGIFVGRIGSFHFVTPGEGGINWGDNSLGCSQLRIVPTNSQTTILINGIQYRGCVEIYSVNGELNVINEVDVENYLKSTLTLQFPKEKDAEVLDALAIVARTQAYYYISRNPGVFWHVEAQKVGYEGYAVVLQNPYIDRAVESTRHMVMTYKDVPFAATWTKNSAGKTATFATIFRKDVQTPSGVSAPLALRDKEESRWTYSLSKGQLANIVKTSKMTKIDLFSDKESSKVYAIRVHNGKAFQDIDFFNLQNAIGDTKLKSNEFTVKVKGDQIVFDGYGEGHGVGLCLYSAAKMSGKGLKAKDILTAFFPHMQLRNMREPVIETGINTPEEVAAN